MPSVVTNKLKINKDVAYKLRFSGTSLERKYEIIQYSAGRLED